MISFRFQSSRSLNNCLTSRRYRCMVLKKRRAKSSNPIRTDQIQNLFFFIFFLNYSLLASFAFDNVSVLCCVSSVIHQNRLQYLKRQTALRLALEQSVETSPTQDGHAGQLYSSQKSSSNKAYSSSIPMATPSQNTQSFSLQQEHVTAVATTYSKNKTTSLIDTSSEHDYLYSGVNNYDPNYIQSQYQNIDASGYSGETPIMVSHRMQLSCTTMGIPSVMKVYAGTQTIIPEYFFPSLFYLDWERNL